MFLLVKNQAPSRLGHLISGTVQDLDALVASHDVRGQLSAPSRAARCGCAVNRRRWGETRRVKFPWFCHSGIPNLVGGFKHDWIIFTIISGMSSETQLTNSYFSEGLKHPTDELHHFSEGLKPPTSPGKELLGDGWKPTKLPYDWDKQQFSSYFGVGCQGFDS